MSECYPKNAVALVSGHQGVKSSTQEPVSERRTPLVVGLTLVAGSLDALGYFNLGHVFVANMTGNVVLLAIALFGGDAGQATRSIWALAGFFMGALATSTLIGHVPNWLLAGLETLFLLIAGVLLWRLPQFGPTAAWAAIASGSVAMGIQSRLARHFNVAGTTTTVVTTTLAQLTDDLVQFAARKPVLGWRVRLMVFCAYAVGAGLAALGRHHLLVVMALVLAEALFVLMMELSAFIILV